MLLNRVTLASSGYMYASVIFTYSLKTQKERPSVKLNVNEFNLFFINKFWNLLPVLYYYYNTLLLLSVKTSTVTICNN